MSKPEQEWLEEQLKLLKGAKIVDAYVDVADDFGYTECWPVLVIDLPKHLIDKESGQQIRAEIMISQDSECNGPGVLLGLEQIKEMTNA
jgi:hypothetical protein